MPSVFIVNEGPRLGRKQECTGTGARAGEVEAVAMALGIAPGPALDHGGPFLA
jgi:hypothetical protein